MRERPAVAAPPRAPALRFPELEGQRGLAALLVPVFHAYQSTGYPYRGAPANAALNSLDAAVDWFFVLSAFLLTLPYARSVLAGHPVASPKDFLARRAVRILPLYVIAVLVVWAVRNPTLPGDWRDLVEHLTFTQTFDSRRIFYTIGPGWSLAVEVQFYLLLAVVGTLLGAAGLRLRRRAARLGLLLSVVTAMVLTSVVWVVVQGVVRDRPLQEYALWFSLPPKLGVFALGMAVAVVVALRPTALPRGVVLALRVGGVAVVVAAAGTRPHTGLGDGVFHLVAGVGFAALVLSGALADGSGSWNRLGSRGALAWVGLVSYSLYLWHEPLLLWMVSSGVLPDQTRGPFVVTAVALLAASLVVAWASWWLVEYPFSHLRSFLGDVPDRRLPAQRRSTP